MANNFVNRSLQGDLQTQAEFVSYAGAQMSGSQQQSLMQGNKTNERPRFGGEDEIAQNGVSLTNLLTNIKVQRPNDAFAH